MHDLLLFFKKIGASLDKNIDFPSLPVRITKVNYVLKS